jgi:hypothetical protein
MKWTVNIYEVVNYTAHLAMLTKETQISSECGYGARNKISYRTLVGKPLGKREL